MFNSDSSVSVSLIPFSPSVSSNTESVNVPGLSTILDNPGKLHSVVKEMTGGLTTGLQDSQIQLIKVFTKVCIFN